MHPASTHKRAAQMLGSGMSASAVARSLGVPVSTVTTWNRLGLPSAMRSACPVEDRELHLFPPADYAALLGFYLGDGCISPAGRTMMLRIACDRTYPGIIADAQKCIESVHPARPVFLVPAPGMFVVQNYWKHWPCLFPQHGPGRKHERPIVLEHWQVQIVTEHPFDFLRGLLHSDGCRVSNWATRPVGGRIKRYDYPRWQFVNRSEDILGLFTAALDLVDVPWRRSNRYTVSVSRRDAVAVLDQRVGFKR